MRAITSEPSLLPLRHWQVLADIWPADDAPLRHPEPLWPVLVAAARESGATILREYVHQFVPHGFTGVLLLAQSHVSIHTWVEQKLLLLDVQSCGPMRPEVMVERLCAALEPCRVDMRSFERGLATDARLGARG